jgi:hypothetical protein
VFTQSPSRQQGWRADGASGPHDACLLSSDTGAVDWNTPNAYRRDTPTAMSGTWAKACVVTVIPILIVDLRSCMHKVMRLCRPFGITSRTWTRLVPTVQCGHQDSAASDGGRDHLPPRILPLQSVQRAVRWISEEHRSSQHIMVKEQMVPFVEEDVRTARGRGADRGNSKHKLRRSAVGPVGIVRHRIPSQPEVLAGCSPEL